MSAKAQQREGRPARRFTRHDMECVGAEQFRAGRNFELSLVIDYLRRADGVGSGAEAAAALDRKEHRR